MSRRNRNIQQTEEVSVKSFSKTSWDRGMKNDNLSEITSWISQFKPEEIVVKKGNDEEVIPYPKKPLQDYTGRTSRSYNNNRDPYLDRISDSYNNNVGRPRINDISTSFDTIKISREKTRGWRPWSRVETLEGIAPPCSMKYFDRTYSRSYSRPYSRPYNTDYSPTIYSYTSTRGRNDRYTFSGSNQHTMSRPGRDYKSLLKEDYRVSSYNNRVSLLETKGRKYY